MTHPHPKSPDTVSSRLEALERELREREEHYRSQPYRYPEQHAGASARADAYEYATDRIAALRAELGGVTDVIPAGFGCYDGIAVHFIDQDRDECVVESRRDGSLVVELIVRPATLNPITGEGEQS